MRLVSPVRRGVAALVLVAALGALLAGPSGMRSADAADEPFNPGSGAASGTVAKVKVFYAGFSLQVATGLAATTYENTQSRALGAGYDLSSALSLVDASQPTLSPVSLDSNAGDAEKRQDLGAGPVLGSIALTAKRVPASTSDVRLADVDLPGLLRVEGGRVRSSSAVVDGSVRRARAEVTVGSISLLGGLVFLDGLRWEALQDSGAKDRNEGAFTLAAVSIAGVPIAVDLEDATALLDVLDVVLAPLGLVLELPQVIERDNGALDVTGLRIGIINSPLGAQAVGPVVAGIRPLLLPVFEALSAANSTLGLASLVADLGLGVADGSGGIEVSVGGVTARTDDSTFVDPLTGVSPVTPPSTGTPSAAPAPPALGGLPTPAAPTTPGIEPPIVNTSSEGPARCVLVASPRRQGSCRGTNLPAAIAVVAIVAAGVGAYDVRLRRRGAAA